VALDVAGGVAAFLRRASLSDEARLELESEALIFIEATCTKRTLDF
jgi:hypothetical protein